MSYEYVAFVLSGLHIARPCHVINEPVLDGDAVVAPTSSADKAKQPPTHSKYVHQVIPIDWAEWLITIAVGFGSCIVSWATRFVSRAWKSEINVLALRNVQRAKTASGRHHVEGVGSGKHDGVGSGKHDGVGSGRRGGVGSGQHAVVNFKSSNQVVPL